MRRKHDPAGPTTLDMFPQMDRQPKQRDEPELTIHCPNCGDSRPISRREWLRTQQMRLRDFREWDEQKQRWRKYRATDPESGPGTPIPCLGCQSSPKAYEWHRSYEREQFIALGTSTPRIERDRQAS